MKPNPGQRLVEYDLIVVLMAVAVIVILSLLGPAISNVFGGTSAEPEVVSPQNLAPERGCYGIDPEGEWHIIAVYGYAGDTHRERHRFICQYLDEDLYSWCTPEYKACPQ